MKKINTNINASLFMFYGEICNLGKENINLIYTFRFLEISHVKSWPTVTDDS